ncbi:MAG TPA: hypothetical protein VIA06_04330 [Candidatus Dormibacteraeota bacterium]|nr:hypothetical protein [Candidatus Dormibacteraeota bacterium]
MSLEADHPGIRRRGSLLLTQSQHACPLRGRGVGEVPGQDAPLAEDDGAAVTVQLDKGVLPAMGAGGGGDGPERAAGEAKGSHPHVLDLDRRMREPVRERGDRRDRAGEPEQEIEPVDRLG